jgi:hypothetical protein
VQEHRRVFGRDRPGRRRTTVAKNQQRLQALPCLANFPDNPIDPHEQVAFYDPGQEPILARPPLLRRGETYVTGRECHRRHGQLSELRRRRHLAWLRLGPLRNEVNGADSRSGEIGRNAPAAIDSMRIGPSDGTTGLLNFHIENLGI